MNNSFSYFSDASDVSDSPRVLSVKKNLSMFIEKDLSECKPLKITYISNRKAKIVR